MRAKASLFNHPIHPSLVPFPLAFLIGSLAFDLLGMFTGRGMYSRTAGHLVVAGIATAVLAAAAGFVDYVYSVPPRSTARHRAIRHAAFNLGAVALFAVSWGLRGFGRPPSGPALLLQVLGAAALIYGSLEGGTLVIRNMMSVDHRHAGAGRWKETTLAPTSGPIVVARKDELKEGQMKLIRVGDRRIALARTNGGYAAIDDRCSHRGASLADGVLIGTTVQCLWHGSRFDCQTGKATGGPAQAPVRSYRVAEQGSEIVIFL
jgi:nitrite reductase/ring-hydroxylating ferredoxin subunit/uncharacterized membrane protein